MNTYSKGWRISDTQEPHWRCLTPLNFFDCTIMNLAMINEREREQVAEAHRFFIFWFGELKYSLVRLERRGGRVEVVNIYMNLSVDWSSQKSLCSELITLLCNKSFTCFFNCKYSSPSPFTSYLLTATTINDPHACYVISLLCPPSYKVSDLTKSH